LFSQHFFLESLQVKLVYKVTCPMCLSQFLVAHR